MMLACAVTRASLGSYIYFLPTNVLAARHVGMVRHLRREVSQHSTSQTDMSCTYYYTLPLYGDICEVAVPNLGQAGR
jgi:hypothetical protein